MWYRNFPPPLRARSSSSKVFFPLNGRDSFSTRLFFLKFSIPLPKDRHSPKIEVDLLPLLAFRSIRRCTRFFFFLAFNFSFLPPQYPAGLPFSLNAQTRSRPLAEFFFTGPPSRTKSRHWFPPQANPTRKNITPLSYVLPISASFLLIRVLRAFLLKA